MRDGGRPPRRRYSSAIRNRDGHADLGAVDPAGVLYVWNGRSGNEFGSAVRVGGGWSAYSKPVGGDFSGDGIGDLAAVRDGKLYIWTGRGGNKFTAAEATGPGWTPYAGRLMSLGDVNGDGHADLASISPDGYLYIWNGGGGNEFGPAQKIGPGWNPHFPA